MRGLARALVYLVLLGMLAALPGTAWCASPLAESKAAPHVREAMDLLREGKAEDAVRECSRAIVLAPDYGVPYEVRALARMKLEEYTSALEDARKAAELAPDHWLAWRVLGLALISLKRWDEAVEALNQGLDLGVRQAPLYEVRARAYEGAGQYRRATDDYSTALLLEPESAGIYNNFAWFLATCPEREFQDGRKAGDLAQKSLALKVTSATLDTLAAAHARAGRFEEAVKAQKRAIAWKERMEGNPVSEGMAKRLREYEAGRPWTEDPSTRP